MSVGHKSGRKNSEDDCILIVLKLQMMCVLLQQWYEYRDNTLEVIIIVREET